MALEQKRITQVEQGALAVVIGAGRSGIAAVRLLVRLGAKVRLLEQNEKNISAALQDEATAAGIEIICGTHNATHFIDARYIIPSPGIPVSTLLPLLPTQNPPEIWAEMELAWRHLKGEPILAVTGTSGKTTTASLAAAMLQAQGLSVFLGGNIGTPLCEYVLSGRKADVLVVEISSFQLQTCSTFCPRVALLLNITENHLDYHKDMPEYIEAKFRLFRCQDEGDVAIIHQSLKPLLKIYTLNARTVWFAKGQKRFPQARLLGAHNESNMEAAWLACREFGVSLEKARIAVAQFSPLPHRLEKVAELNDVLYVNDSKCTTVFALQVALEAFERPLILLCGGKFKGGDLEGLRPLLQKHVKTVFLFGASREYFEKAWVQTVPMEWSATLKEALTKAQACAMPNDVVLMAPATSSFDLYENYIARGKDFIRLVKELPC